MRKGFDLLTTRVEIGDEERDERDKDKMMVREEKAIGMWEEKENVEVEC